MKTIPNPIFWILISAMIFACNPREDREIINGDKPTTAVIKRENGKYRLFVNGEPFYIKGAGLEFGDISKLAAHGGNSFRTWTTDNGRQSGKEVLDEAWKHGLYVTMGLNVGSERHGFDYNDERAINQQKERIRAEVMELKDHPALFIWAIGNELNLHASNPNVWDAVNDISRMIHELDPHHLTTTPIAGISKELINDIKSRAYDIDLLSIQMYADIVNIPRYIQETGWEGPYIISEWGATGHWEVPLTEWSVPIENNSSVKAQNYLKRYQTAIATQSDQCLGSYVFLWGQKQERTPTWYGMFMPDGNETEAIDVMHYIWNNKWPSNRSPQLIDFRLNGKTAYENVYLEAGQSYEATVSVDDPDDDQIHFTWVVMHESTDLGEGGDFESTPDSLPGLVKEIGAVVYLTAPAQSGAYRLFIYAEDGEGHTAHGNIPFFVQ